MSYDPTDINKLSEEADERVRESKIAQKEEDDDLKWLMSSKRGRRFVYRFLNRYGAWAHSFNTNAMQMAFNEGRRHCATTFEDYITQHCFDSYIEMLREQRKEEDGNVTE